MLIADQVAILYNLISRDRKEKPCQRVDDAFTFGYIEWWWWKHVGIKPPVFI